MKEDDVLVAKHVSTLQELSIQHVNTIKQLLSRIEENESQLQSKSEAMKAELNRWKEKHSLAEKALQRARSHHAEAIESPPLQLNDTKDSHYQLQQQNDKLVEKLGRLMYENGQLRAKRQCQEEEESQHEELLVLVEDLQAEKDEIHELMSKMSVKLVDLEQVHEDCTHSYETQLASLKDEVNQVALSKEKMNTQLSRKLKAQTEERRKLKMESEEAYQTCEVFQQEIDALYEALEERSLRAHSSYPRTQQKPSQILCLGQDEMIIDNEERDSYLDRDFYLDHF
jgi:chromosome segregation ATPase